MGTEFQSWIAGTCLLWSGGLDGIGICVPLELQFQGSPRPAVGCMSTRPFIVMYIMQTLSDILLECRFSSRSWATTAEAL